MNRCAQSRALAVISRAAKGIARGGFACMVMLAIMFAMTVPLRPAHAAERRTPVVEAVEKALPSVVNIGTERLVKVRYSDPARRFRGDLFDRFFSEFFSLPPTPGYRVGHSLGSGVIVHPDGYILTNHHVVERASRILVTLADESAYAATVVAVDEISDIALIKIDPEEPLDAVTFAEDEDLLLGETVIVLGNPFGLSHTVTVGVLSAMNRRATYQGEVLYKDILQTDAAVNPGSSGGPMLNADGHLIGLNVAVYQDAQNIGFAIPVKRVRALLSEWMSPRYIKENWLGMDFKAAENGRVTVARVYAGSDAERSDIREGDAVVAADQKPMKNLVDLNSYLLSRRRGDVVALLLDRAGKRISANVRIEAVPKPSGRDLAQERLGLVFPDDDERERGSRTGVYRKGLPIESVVKDSPADRLGLQAGHWITRINDHEIRTLDDVGMALEQVPSGSVVTLVVLQFDERESFIMAQSSRVQVTVD